MPSGSSAESVFLEHLQTIDMIAERLCRRRGLGTDRVEDFVASVRARFVESEYAAFKQFRGESSITTYLTVVIARWLKDDLVAERGRWRPSTAALRLGASAVHLERLLQSNGATAVEAIATVVNQAGEALSEKEAWAIVRQLPRRQPLRPLMLKADEADDVPDETLMPDHSLLAAEEGAQVEQVFAAIESAIAFLPAQDQLLVRLRYLQGQTVADVAKVLGVDQKPLYRRFERVLGELRETLITCGISGFDSLSTDRTVRSAESASELLRAPKKGKVS
jgi:RNA polymerase sigma factor (sigma-70 family)